MNKKITYIISDIDRSVFFEQTAVALKEKDIDVSFILINCEKSHLHQFLIKHNFLVKNLQSKKLIKSLPVIIKCRKILTEIKPEIIHCHLGAANTIGLIAGFLSCIKTRIYTRHAGLPLNSPKKEKLIDFLNNTLATTIIATTINTENILLEQKVQKEKIVLIHYGFNIERMMTPNKEEVIRIKNIYNERDQHPIIGIIARWVDWKGIQYIIPAFKKLLQQYPSAKLCLFNANQSAPYAEQINQLLYELPAKNYIVVPFEYNVYDMYQLFDIYIHTPINTTCEAFGQTYIEALAAGIPGIFTLAGVAKEFIRNEDNALTVNFENSEEIYQAMNRLLENTDLVNRLTTNGKKDVLQYFNMNIYIDKLLEIYK